MPHIETILYFRIVFWTKKKSKRSLNLDFSFNLENWRIFVVEKKLSHAVIFLARASMSYPVTFNSWDHLGLPPLLFWLRWNEPEQQHSIASLIQYKINSKFRWSTFIVVNYCISMRMQRQTTKPSHTRTHTQVEVWKSQWIKIFAHVKPSQIGRID